MREVLGVVTIRFLNVKKILAVINATYAVAKRKPEKIRLAGIITARIFFTFISSFRSSNI